MLTYANTSKNYDKQSLLICRPKVTCTPRDTSVVLLADYLLNWDNFIKIELNILSMVLHDTFYLFLRWAGTRRGR